MLANGLIDEVEEFSYLGSVVNTTGDTNQDVKARLGKARSTFGTVDRLWKYKIMSIACSLTSLTHGGIVLETIFPWQKQILIDPI